MPKLQYEKGSGGKIMIMYLVRHALPGVIPYDNHFPGTGLGDMGKRQAQWISGFLENEKIECVWASDFTRTIETAAVICTRFPNLELSYDVRLRERNPEVETHESLVARVSDWYQSTIEKLVQERTMVVAHGGSINMILNCIDPGFQEFDYPHIDKYDVRTPIAGIWKVDIHARTAELTQCPFKS